VAEERGRGEGEEKREEDEDIWKQRRIYEEQGEVREKEQEISFTTKSPSYCVCFVSMVDLLKLPLQLATQTKL
jgi:hypothetical protein